MTICSQIAIEILQQLVIAEPRIKVRYGFDELENLHLIEVSPGFIYDEAIVEQYEHHITIECLTQDSTSSVMFFKANDMDFEISECMFEAQGEAYGFDRITFAAKFWSELNFNYQSPMAIEIGEISYALAA